MKTILKIIRSFFVFLGVIFFILILGAIYIWIADPFNFRALIPSNISFSEVVKDISSGENNQSKIFDVNNIDLSSEITPEMEKCFIEKLGKERVGEIMKGDETTPSDFLKAGVCLEKN